MEVLRKAFSQKLDPVVSDYVNCVSDDEAFIAHDINGSIAHTKMLERGGLLTADQSANIQHGLQSLAEASDFTLKADYEDVHMNVEKALEELIGTDALRLHTARSRNDQVALDLHAYTRLAIKDIVSALGGVQEILIATARNNLDAVMPGYTHLQRAQPVLFSHALLAFVSMLQRDKDRFNDAYKRADCSPLGAGALAGSSLPIAPALSAHFGGYGKCFDNSMDAVSDRDFIAEFLSCCAITAIHVSQLAETFVIWASSEFNFVTFGDNVTTSSSLMPNKKNPDPLEIARAKAGTICGDLINVLMVLKSLPLGYNRDLQETKPPLVNSAETIHSTLKVLKVVLQSMTVNHTAMLKAASDPFVIATDLVEYLVTKGVPFRQAHEQIAELFAHCRNGSTSPLALPLAQLQRFAPGLDADALELFDPVASANAKVSSGGTARSQVEHALAVLEA
jgi:argininosuccinate lyase